MDLAMRQGYGACALPLCGGGRLLRRRSETDRFSLFFSIFIFFIVFSCVLFVFSFMASPYSARPDRSAVHRPRTTESPLERTPRIGLGRKFHRFAERCTRRMLQL